MSLIFKVLFFLLLILAFSIFTFSSYLNVNYWLVGVIAHFTPIVFFITLFFLGYWIYKKKYLLVALSLLVYVAGFKELRKTFVINFKDKTELPGETIKVLSYNVGTFNLKRYNRIQDTITPGLMMDWFKKNTDADIVCLQEFYNNSISDVENSVQAITGIKRLSYFYTNPIFWHDMRGFFGVITFSRYPIINSGPLIFGDSSLNRGVYLDLKVRNDTVRLINVHLHSMTIRLDTTSNIFFPVKVVRNTIDIFERLKDGIQKRSEEVDVITKFIDSSPYPVILCGDFNDPPYSYTYNKISKILSNSFEGAGFGFGFTYSGFPWIIRIDNQFHSDKLKAVSFKIFSDNKYSDHYPIQAEYIFRPEKVE